MFWLGLSQETNSPRDTVSFGSTKKGLSLKMGERPFSNSH